MKTRYFDTHFNQVNNPITFNEAWCNGTDYFDGAVRLVKLEPGKMGTSIDPHGRKLIMVGTRFGTCVFFERYVRSDDVQEQTHVVSNVPRELRHLVTSGSLNYDEFTRLVAGHLNIGIAVEDMFKTMEKNQNKLQAVPA